MTALPSQRTASHEPQQKLISQMFPTTARRPRPRVFLASPPPKPPPVAKYSITERRSKPRHSLRLASTINIGREYEIVPANVRAPDMKNALKVRQALRRRKLYHKKLDIENNYSRPDVMPSHRKILQTANKMARQGRLSAGINAFYPKQYWDMKYDLEWDKKNYYTERYGLGVKLQECKECLNEHCGWVPEVFVDGLCAHCKKEEDEAGGAFVFGTTTLGTTAPRRTRPSRKRKIKLANRGSFKKRKINHKRRNWCGMSLTGR